MMKGIICAMIMVASSSPISGLFADIDEIRDCAGYIAGDGSVVVALLTTPIYTASGRKELENSVRDKISNAGYQCKVYISFDTDIYLELLSCKDDMCAKSIINLIMSREKY